MHTVTAVIPCYNLWDRTSALLISLITQADRELSRIVVVDNGSTDETEREAPFFGEAMERTLGIAFRYVRFPHNRGFAAAVNAGIAEAIPNARVCIFNNDMLVRPGWLSWLNLALDVHPALGMVSPSVNHPELSVAAWRQMPMPVPGSDAKALLDVRYRIYDVPWLYSPECLAQVGPFDEQFERGTWEDHDYLVRMARCGWEWGRCFNTVVYHYWNQTQLLVQQEEGQGYFQRNRERFAKKWGTDQYLSLLPPIKEELEDFLA